MNKSNQRHQEIQMASALNKKIKENYAHSDYELDL